MTATVELDKIGKAGNRSVTLTNNNLIKQSEFFYRGKAVGFVLYVQAAPEHFGWFPVPDWIRDEFRGGNSVEPVIDWLIETYGGKHPWLYDFTKQGETDE